MEDVIKVLTTENEFIYNIIAYPLALLEFFVLYLIIKAIYKIDTTKKQSIIFVATCAIVGSTIRLIFPMPFNFILNALCITLIIMFVLKLSFFKSVIPFCIFLLATAISELIVFLILKQLAFSILTEAEHVPLYKIVCCLCIYSLIILSIKTITMFKTNLNISDTISTKNKMKIILNVLVAIIIVYPNVIFLIMVDMRIPTYYILYNLICALVLFFITTYNTHKFNKLEITKRELETANLYNNTLSQLVDMNRGFKHDIGNIVQAIGGYVELNDLEGLKHYYQTGLLPEIEKANNLSLLNPETINSPPIFGLLLSKYNYASTKNVKLRITSFFDYASINMSIFDFVKVLGILLDNAIEASSLCEEKLVDLHISIDFYNRKQIFKISNTYINKDIDLGKIFEKNYSTKEQKSGFGLWEVSQIINKTQNVKLQTTKTETYVIQKLEIYF